MNKSNEFQSSQRLADNRALCHCNHMGQWAYHSWTELAKVAKTLCGFKWDYTTNPSDLHIPIRIHNPSPSQDFFKRMKSATAYSKGHQNTRCISQTGAPSYRYCRRRCCLCSRLVATGYLCLAFWGSVRMSTKLVNTAKTVAQKNV